MLKKFGQWSFFSLPMAEKKVHHYSMPSFLLKYTFYIYHFVNFSGFFMFLLLFLPIFSSNSFRSYAFYLIQKLSFFIRS